MPRYLSEIQLKSLKDHGFLLVKNVFSKDEIQSLQSKCSKKCSLVKFNKSVPGDIFEDDDLRTILFKKDIIDLVKDILGENPIYFRDSQLHCKPNERINNVETLLSLFKEKINKIYFKHDADEDRKNINGKILTVFSLKS